MLVSWQFFPCWNGVFSLLLWVKVWEDCRRSLVLIFFGGRYANTCTYPFLWSRAVEHPQFVDGGIFQWCIAELHRIALYLYISIYIYICIFFLNTHTYIYIHTHKPVYIISICINIYVIYRYVLIYTYVYIYLQAALTVKVHAHTPAHANYIQSI